MKWRTKPVIKEAEQWFPGKAIAGVCTCQSDGPFIDAPHVHTIHDNQSVKLEPGDFVVPEPDGIHYYPCKPDIWLERHEPVLGAD